MKDPAAQLVPAVDRAIRMLLDLRSAEDGKGISDLSRDLAIPKSSAFQIAATMVHHDLLVCDEHTRRYRLGPGLQTLVGATGRRPDVAALAAPHLRTLADETGLTALLGLPTTAGTVLAARADSPEPLGVSAPVGFELDLMAGAFGKVFAAALGEPDRTARLRRLPAFTARSIVDSDEMDRELERVRRNGVATDIEEYLDGIRAAAAPVRDGEGNVLAAICALGVAARLKQRRLAEVAQRVRRAAAALSRDLGAREAGREVA
ncbi:MAG: IclR family transcriptional regulator [Acidobacteriota bacterium]|jgi:DNA-binding IclR family transcriptional regulator